MQIEDLLAKHRRKPVHPEDAPASTASEDVEGYTAFSFRDSVDFLEIRMVSAPWRSPVYDYKLDVSFDGLFGTSFVIHFTLFAVFVRGRNLLPVIRALQRGKAAFIEEFDSSKWPMPTDEKAPFITSIRIQMNDSGSPPVSESEQARASSARPRLH